MKINCGIIENVVCILKFAADCIYHHPEVRKQVNSSSATIYLVLAFFLACFFYIKISILFKPGLPEMK